METESANETSVSDEKFVASGTERAKQESDEWEGEKPEPSTVSRS